MSIARIEGIEKRCNGTDEEIAELRDEITSLRDQLADLREQMAALASAAPPKPKTVRAAPASAGGGAKPPRAKKEAPPMPEPVEGAPDASEYRMKPEDINHGVCLHRIVNDTDASRDQRWSPAVYRELQCGAEVPEGSDICVGCQRRRDKMTETGKLCFHGLITEEPPEWIHMLGTTWAETKKPRWLGEVCKGSRASRSETGSVTSSVSAAKPKRASAGGGKKAASAAKPAPKPSAVPAAAAAEVAPVVAMTIKMIEGAFYIVKDTEVYEYDEMMEQMGSLVGHLEDGKIVPLEAGDAEEADAAAE